MHPVVRHPAVRLREGHRASLGTATSVIVILHTACQMCDLLFFGLGSSAICRMLTPVANPQRFLCKNFVRSCPSRSQIADLHPEPASAVWSCNRRYFFLVHNTLRISIRSIELVYIFSIRVPFTSILCPFAVSRRQFSFSPITPGLLLAT